MKALRNKSIVLLASVMSLFGWGGGYLLENHFVDFHPGGYHFIPIMFFVMGVVVIWSLTSLKEMDNDRKIINKYMLLKVAKVFVILIILVLYWAINREEIRNFAILTIIFSFVYLIFEVYFFVQVERRVKMEQNLLKEE